eukprot:2861464-Pyramimonas_sp.AAC.1
MDELGTRNGILQAWSLPFSKACETKYDDVKDLLHLPLFAEVLIPTRRIQRCSPNTRGTTSSTT